MHEAWRSLRGWFVPIRVFLGESICYLVGVGEDISFDLSLIEELGCDVWAYDPTPRAVEHVRRSASAVDEFHFEPVGLWTEQATLKWFAQEIRLMCRTLWSICKARMPSLRRTACL